MSDLTAFAPHDPICPAPHASDVCMCPWIAKARADERDGRIPFDVLTAKVRAAVERDMHQEFADDWQLRQQQMRADLRAKVEALDTVMLPGWAWPKIYVDRSAVIDLLDGDGDA